MYNGRRQPSRGGTSRMTRECQVRICEGLGVPFPGPTRQSGHSTSRDISAIDRQASPGDETGSGAGEIGD
jgi:hypothetical protein